MDNKERLIRELFKAVLSEMISTKYEVLPVKDIERVAEGAIKAFKSRYL